MEMERDLRVRYPGGVRSLWGAGAYVLGYAFTFAFVGPRLGAMFGQVVVAREYAGDVTLADVLETGTVPAWKVIGVVLYGAHLAPAGVSYPDGGAPNLVLAAGGPYLALLIVPPILLTGAGVLVTRGATSAADLRFDLGDHRWRRYAVNGGLTVTFGYLPLALVGAFFFTFDIPGPGQFVVDYLYAWVLVGLAYPLIFGGLGGMLVYLARKQGR